jgi:hypothetical protein
MANGCGGLIVRVANPEAVAMMVDVVHPIRSQRRCSGVRVENALAVIGDVTSDLITQPFALRQNAYKTHRKICMDRHS